MKKILIKIAIPFLLITGCSIHASEVNKSVGFGLQYSGIIGYQMTLDNDNHRFRGSVGLIGAGVGYDYLFSPNFSVGVSVTGTIRNVYSVNLNYYVTSPYDGLRFGLDIGHMPAEGGSNSIGSGGFGFAGSGPKESRNVVWFSIGYAF